MKTNIRVVNVQSSFQEGPYVFQEGAKITLMLANRNIRDIQEHHVTVTLVTDGFHYCGYSSQP